MHPVTRTGLRLFVCATAPGVALLAVVTESPSVMALFAAPGAVVGYVAHRDHAALNRSVGRARTTAGRRPARTYRSGTCSLPSPRPEAVATADTARGRHQARLLRQALDRTGLTPHRVWLRYLAHGGAVGELEIDAYLHDSLHLPPGERDRLVLAVNALLDVRVHPHVPTTRDLSRPPRTEGSPRDHHG